MARSALHERVYTQLSTSPIFQGRRILEEVLVKELFPQYISSRDRYDIVLPELNLVIECHGIQHYKVQTFGADAGKALINHQLQKDRDYDKKEIALLSGWHYLEVPYTQEKTITAELIYQAYKEMVDNPIHIVTVAPPEPEEKADPYHEKRLAMARDWRKEQYQKFKERINEVRRSSGKASSSSEEET